MAFVIGTQAGLADNGVKNKKTESRAMPVLPCICENGRVTRHDASP